MGTEGVLGTGTPSPLNAHKKTQRLSLNNANARSLSAKRKHCLYFVVQSRFLEHFVAFLLDYVLSESL